MNGPLATWGPGLPVRPVGAPGAAVSPGTRTRSRSKAPAPTAIGPLVPLLEDPATPTVWVPAALRVAPSTKVRRPRSPAVNA